MYLLKKEFRITKKEIGLYSLLPDNLPDNRLTQKQKDFVSLLYRKYIGKIDNKGWSRPMYGVEQSEKWPSGPRTKMHEAKRVVLGNLMECQSVKQMTNRKAATRFHSALTCRPMYAKLLSEIYQEA